MKNITFLLACFGFLNFANAQYQVGVPVVDTIYTGWYSKLDVCTPDEDVNIQLDDIVLENYVTGLTLSLVIKEINIPQGNLSTTTGELSVNDELSLELDNPSHPFYMSDVGDFTFMIIASGTPEIVEESYPCNFIEFVTQTNCQNGYLIVHDDFFEDCLVEEGMPVNVNDPVLSQQLSVYPNPVNDGHLKIINDSPSPIDGVRFFNTLGQEVLSSKEQILNEDVIMNTSSLSPGVYLMRITIADQELTRKVIVAQ